MEISVREDESSVQYFATRHPYFWIRIVKPVRATMTISNAMSGGVHNEEMLAALVKALRSQGSCDLRKVEFMDIVAGDFNDRIDKAEMKSRFKLLRHATYLWADQCNLHVADGYIRQTRGKLNAVFELQSDLPAVRAIGEREQSSRYHHIGITSHNQ